MFSSNSNNNTINSVDEIFANHPESILLALKNPLYVAQILTNENACKKFANELAKMDSSQITDPTIILNVLSINISNNNFQHQKEIKRLNESLSIEKFKRRVLEGTLTSVSSQINTPAVPSKKQKRVKSNNTNNNTNENTNENINKNINENASDQNTLVFKCKGFAPLEDFQVAIANCGDNITTVVFDNLNTFLSNHVINLLKLKNLPNLNTIRIIGFCPPNLSELLSNKKSINRLELYDITGDLGECFKHNEFKRFVNLKSFHISGTEFTYPKCEFIYNFIFNLCSKFKMKLDVTATNVNEFWEQHLPHASEAIVSTKFIRNNLKNNNSQSNFFSQPSNTFVNQLNSVVEVVVGVESPQTTSSVKQ